MKIWVLDAIGIDIKMLIAGFAGGAVRQFFFGKVGKTWEGWADWAASIIGGGLTASYAGSPAAHLFGIPEPFAGFSVGVGAVFVAQGIISFAKVWATKQEKG